MITTHRGARAILHAIAATGKVMESGPDKWVVSCPCKQNHSNGDSRPSASVWIEDRRVRCWCAKKCSFQDWVAALRTPRSWWESPDRADGFKPRKIGDYVVRWDYHNEDGSVAYSVRKTADKQFFQVRRHGDVLVYGLKEGWYKNADRQGYRPCREGDPGAMWFDAVPHLPYKLPELIALPKKDIVVITEGEKDADNVSALGIFATCNSGGAGKFTSEHAKYFAGRCVIIVPDKDSIGFMHAAQVAGLLQIFGARATRIVLWDDDDGLPDKGDISDWIKNQEGPTRQIENRLFDRLTKGYGRRAMIE